MYPEDPATEHADGPGTMDGRSGIPAAHSTRSMPSRPGKARERLTLWIRLVIVSPVAFLFVVLTAFLLLSGVAITMACEPFASSNSCWWARSDECRPLGVVLLHFIFGTLCLMESYYLIELLVRRRPDKCVRLEVLGLVGLCLGVAAFLIIVDTISHHRRMSIPIPSRGSPVASIRAALASYAADSHGNTFPAAIADWGTLTTLVNAHANCVALKPTEKAQGVSFRGYTPSDEDGDEVYEDYTMSFRITGLSADAPGSVIFISPGGFWKGTLRP